MAPSPDLRYLTGYEAPPFERFNVLVIRPGSDPILLVPELEVQKRVCAELSERLSSVERIKRTVDTQLRTMAALREALLRRAFSGEA